MEYECNKEGFVCFIDDLDVLDNVSYSKDITSSILPELESNIKNENNLKQIYNNCTIINGNVIKSNIQTDNNYNELINYIKEYSKTLKLQSQIDDLNRLVNDLEDKIKEKEKTNIIKSCIINIKDFLLSIGASVAASLITNYLK